MVELGTEFQHCAGCGLIWDCCECNQMETEPLLCVYWQDGRPCINKNCYNEAWVPVCPELPNYNKDRLDKIEKIADGILAVKPNVDMNRTYFRRIKIAAVIVDHWNMFKEIMEDETNSL